MEYIKIKDILSFQKKSKIKASEGSKIGKYNFYTSSKDLNKFLDYYEYSNEALIIGTGGNANLHHSYGKFSVSTDCIVLESKDKNFLVEFIYRYLLKNIHILENGFRGAGLKHISKEYLENIKIPIISLEKQKIIIKNLKNIDIFIDENKQIKNKLNFLNKSLFISMFFSGNKNFERKKLKENVTEMFIGPFGSDLKNEVFVEKERGYCVVYEQKHAIKKRIDDEIRYITKEKYEVLKRFRVDAGDIIVSCRGTIGKIFVLPSNSNFGIIHPSLMKIKLKKEKYNNTFFEKLLEKYMQENLYSIQGSSIKMAITAKKLGEEYFIIPPIELQNEFSNRIEKIEKLSFEIEEAIKQAENLYNSLLSKYFD
ncbi:hypothetical protein RN96_07445 [Fusobacterium polymorphum]|uniref:Type I restriction modification DNA specificity domain-containing protein n=1 Tax=Fusobacterium nucleatum subsp. polymorphum TaxID=76857 RepID=A0A2B7YIM0_FUSNP|nr:restriction endonuclease subunit S [Fusobacterium polymorphum]PGH20911.1 hypothetical protein RN96_07445 [Fusobacterium polymorphum]